MLPRLSGSVGQVANLSYKPMSRAFQGIIATFVAIAFALLSVYFGFFPGSSRPSWGGQAHWEVPAALLLEWAFALIAFLPFRLARSRSNDGGT